MPGDFCSERVGGGVSALLRLRDEDTGEKAEWENCGKDPAGRRGEGPGDGQSKARERKMEGDEARSG